MARAERATTFCNDGLWLQIDDTIVHGLRTWSSAPAHCYTLCGDGLGRGAQEDQDTFQASPFGQVWAPGQYQQPQQLDTSVMARRTWEWPRGCSSRCVRPQLRAVQLVQPGQPASSPRRWARCNGEFHHLAGPFSGSAEWLGSGTWLLWH